jgi:NhaP-type Na+/H+ or K+/H+ antiporter
MSRTIVACSRPKTQGIRARITFDCSEAAGKGIRLEAIDIGVLALLTIAGAAWFGPRLRIAAPLILVVVGIAVSVWPDTPRFIIDPEWIIAGILPPLLYSAAVSMPTMEFRRDFAAISGLAVLLVVLTSFVVGWLLSVVIPDIDFATGLALGAILSPTDAVATSIVKRLGVAPRAVVVLEGESLLNDASALVLLRTAIGASAASISLLHLAGDFLYSVIVATIIGVVVGQVNLRIRMRASDPTVNTALSLTVPFLAAIPAEALEASGLVAAVVAGLITGFLGPRYLSPQFRLSDRQNWRTIEFVLEGAVFLIMGLELEWVLDDVRLDHYGIPKAFQYAAIALLATIVVRAIYVIPLIYAFRASAQRADDIATMLQHRLLDPFSRSRFGRRMRGLDEETDTETIERFRTSWRRRLADIDYFRTETIGWREGTVIVWAGMRGAVTLAAAQTLPRDTPARSLLVLVAFLVASISLLLQGSTLPWLVKRVLLPTGEDERSKLERVRLSAQLRAAGIAVLQKAGLDAHGPFPELSMGPIPPASIETQEQQQESKRIQLEMVEAQRVVLLKAMNEGSFSSDTLNAAMANLDADQISLEIKGAPPGTH